MRLQYSNLRISKLEYNPRFPISPKQAINLGIKSSMNHHIVISAPNVTPSGDEWLAMMGKGFMRGDVVLSYTAIEQGTRIGVDEEGVEAAAYTAIGLEAAGIAPEELEVVEMNLNRPFIYLITAQDGSCNQLFIGPWRLHTSLQ
jgi:hypothetical protein